MIKIKNTTKNTLLAVYIISTILLIISAFLPYFIIIETTGLDNNYTPLFIPGFLVFIYGGWAGLVFMIISIVYLSSFQIKSATKFGLIGTLLILINFLLVFISMFISYPRTTEFINGVPQNSFVATFSMGAYLGPISSIFLLIINIFLYSHKEDNIRKLGKGKKELSNIEIPEKPQIQLPTQTININIPSSSNFEEKNQNTKYCQMCGKPIEPNAGYCEFCGGEQ